MKREHNKKQILIGYRAKGITTYRTPLKPLGYVVAGVGVACLSVAVFPNGLGIFFYPLGFWFLGIVGIDLFKTKKNLKNKLRFMLWRFRK